MTKKLFIKTYGCQMNVYDSERMASAMAANGYEEVDRADRADMIVLNTCHIREKAAEKVYSELGRLKPLKRANPNLKIAVAGCVAQAEGAEIVRRAPVVDLVVGPQAYHRLPAMADAKGVRIDTDFPEEDKFDRLPPRRIPLREGPRSASAAFTPTAFMTVQEGCDKFCAFCVVPYTRGAEVSRPAARLLSEAADLAAAGVVEITLLGQNVNAWRGAAPDRPSRGGLWSLARLIRELAAVEGLKRLRYTTSHPNDMTDDLIAAHAEVPELMPFLHLPVQSGSDRVLEAMNRRHTAENYIRTVERIRAARSDMAISGDFITGFPGETEADFQETLALVREVNYAQAFSFKYSPRPGTPAATADAEAGGVPEDEKADRLARLQALLAEQRTAFQRSMIGRALPVLIEKTDRETAKSGSAKSRSTRMIGRSPWLQTVHFECDPARIGEIVDVAIVKAGPNSLTGSLAGAESPARAATV